MQVNSSDKVPVKQANLTRTLSIKTYLNDTECVTDLDEHSLVYFCQNTIVLLYFI